MDPGRASIPEFWPQTCCSKNEHGLLKRDQSRRETADPSSRATTSPVLSCTSIAREVSQVGIAGSLGEPASEPVGSPFSFFGPVSPARPALPVDLNSKSC